MEPGNLSKEQQHDQCAAQCNQWVFNAAKNPKSGSMVQLATMNQHLKTTDFTTAFHISISTYQSRNKLTTLLAICLRLINFNCSYIFRMPREI